MIHVVVTGPRDAEGKFPYRIEGQSSNHGRPIHDLAAFRPLFDACRVLAEAGEPPDRLIGLFGSEQFGYLGPTWAMRTTVGYGSRAPRAAVSPAVRSFEEAATPIAAGGKDASAGSLDAGVPTTEEDMVTLGEYREFPGGPIKTVGQPTIPAAPPPPPHTPPAPPADTGPVAAKPAKSGKSHHPRKPKASSGRRGHSRGR